LDLGCGTGISTRQLAKGKGIVIGCDIDPVMLATAMADKHQNIAYVQGSAEKIPFNEKTFDAVTMFSAFHWFVEKKRALREIKRVLKPSGVVCVVQRRHVSSFAKDFRELLEAQLKTKFAIDYSKADFSTALRASGFKRVHKEVVKTVDVYTLDGFLKVLQSYSVWNKVPQAKRKKVLQVMRKHYATKLLKGRIQDAIELDIIFAKV
jgi:ubiquinone/menaquinone biosynthesis C-methylase UbiE